MTDTQKPYLLYLGGTPNGRQVTIFFEEARIDYKIRPVDLQNGGHQKPAFLKMSPNGTVPALIDPNGPNKGLGKGSNNGTGHERLSLFDSGAILQYLGRKHGAFYPIRTRGRVEVDQWLMFQRSALGPVCEFAYRLEDLSSEEINSRADVYFRDEILRLYTVLNTRLKGRDFIAGDYSIADMAIFPWIVANVISEDFDNLPNLQAWYARLSKRPAIIRGMGIG